MTSVYGLMGSVALMLTGWLLAQSRDAHDQPIRVRVSLGQAMASVGLVTGLLTIPTSLPPWLYALGLALMLVSGLLLVRAASRLSVGWTSAAEVLTTAAGLAWVRPVRAIWSAVCLVAGLGVAVWALEEGNPAAGLLGAAVVIAPARWHLPHGYTRETARTGVERAMAGSLSGGLEWDVAEASLRGAPVRVRFDREDRPVRISAPLPPSWKSSSEEGLTEELGRRLSEWGTPWVVAVDHSSARRVTCSRGEPLPERVDYAGQRPDGLRLPLGLARVSPAAALAGVGKLGQVVPFYADLADSPSGLIVGSMGSGKSVLVRLIILLWCRWIGPAYLLDPKRVEFSIFRGRKNVRTVATTLEQIAAVLAEIETEMHRRFALMEAAGVQHVNELKEHLDPLLTVCDEFFELVARNPGSDETTKVENEVRAQCASSARAIAALGRAAGVHIILLAQRADAEVVKGSLQNNLLLRALLRPLSAGATARNMVGMNDVMVSENPKGRALMRTAIWPESEVQVYYVDAADLDRYLPKVEQPAAPDSAERDDSEAGSKPAKKPATKPTTKSAKIEPDAGGAPSQGSEENESDAGGESSQGREETEPDAGGESSQDDDGPDPMSWFEDE